MVKQKKKKLSLFPDLSPLVSRAEYRNNNELDLPEKAKNNENIFIDIKESSRGLLNLDHTIDDPVVSLRLNPRRRYQNVSINIGNTGLKIYFSTLDRVQELRVENQ